MLNWQISELRVTAMPAVVPFPVDRDWWSTACDSPPDEKLSKPKEGARIEQGVQDDARLIMSASLFRIDWRLTSAADPVGAISSLGEYPRDTPQFLERMKRWLSSEEMPVLNRLALGIELFSPVGSREAGYAQLDRLLPSVDVDPSTSDFFYQINRRRDFDGTSINRLTRWSVRNRRVVLNELGSDRTAPLHDESAVALYLDINNVPQELRREQLPALLDTFAQLAAEIADKGDVP